MQKYMTTAEIRSAFLKFFERQGHTIVSSSSLIPANDPSLFFTNAGMVQFKGVFLGQERYSFSRATTCQRCVRASGKHNDLENVGYTTRHHTFFEMLGNFSFGDYFKREAIHYAWTFLTQELKIDAKRLWVTVHEKDQEAESLWQQEFQQSNLFPQGVSHCGDHDNFWSMGETGPCGFCSEIYYDHGAELAGDPPGGALEGERYVEIWNLVFMQFNRDVAGNLTPLPHPSIDTGMGLERIAAVMQGVYDNYEIDIFRQLKQQALALIQQEVGAKVTTLNVAGTQIASRVIVDHIRSAVFLIADGVLPGNERRGYVLRSIIRRAAYYLFRIGINKPFFFKLVAPFVAQFQDVYPEVKLADLAAKIATVIQQEEQKFFETLERGLKIFQQEVARLPNRELPGSLAFTLHDTYGLPIILTTELARGQGLTLDQAGFDAAMQRQKEASRQASKVSAQKLGWELPVTAATNFVGYTENCCTSKVLAVLSDDGKQQERLARGSSGVIIVDTTACYAESGGQVGDQGEICKEGAIFQITDTQKQQGVFLHYGKVISGDFQVNDQVTVQIDEVRRSAIAANHSATHLLHRSLRVLIDDAATQKGSSVTAERLRFDFAATTALSAQQLRQLEELVNQQIRANLTVTTQITTLAEAQRLGACALFGEKYDAAQVRLVTMGDFSRELCGGSHVAQTGEIGYFKIVSEESVSSGVRRIEALTGAAAVVFGAQLEQKVQQLAELLTTAPEQIVARTQQLLIAQKEQQERIQHLAQQLQSVQVKQLAAQARLIKQIALVVTQVEEQDGDLRVMIDELRGLLPCAVIVLTSGTAAKMRVVVGVTDNLVSKLTAKDLLRCLVAPFGGNGGGNGRLAQGGCSLEGNMTSAKFLTAIEQNVMKILTETAG